MKNQHKFLFVSIAFLMLLIVGKSTTAQKNFISISQKNSIIIKDSFPPFPGYLSTATGTNNKLTSFSISPAAAFCNRAFFCRQEVKLEKVIKVPVKFRLGSLEQANYYEGKK